MMLDPYTVLNKQSSKESEGKDWVALKPCNIN